MKQKIFQYSLSFLTSASAVLAWWSVDRAINIESASVWLAPMGWFSLLFILFSLSVIIIKNKTLIGFIAFLILASSLVFILSLGQILFIILGFLLLLYAIWKIREELQARISISIYKSLRMGCVWIILAFSLVVSSGYYFEVRSTNQERGIPKFGIGELSSSITPSILKNIFPGFFKEKGMDATADDFILWMSQNQVSGVSSSFDLMGQLEKMTGASADNLQVGMQSLGDIQKVMLIEEGRSKLSEAAGFPISGREKFSDVISKMIDEKFSRMFNHNNGAKLPSYLTIFIALGLFLSIYSLGVMLDYLLIQFTRFVFFILVKSQLVHIGKVERDVEIIE